MTIKEFCAIAFRWTGHSSWEDEHCTTYYSDEYGIGFCDHVRYKDGKPYGRKYTHYAYRNKVYSCLSKFLIAYNKEEVHYIDERRHANG